MQDGYGKELPAVVYNVRNEMTKALPDAIYKFLSQPHYTIEQMLQELEQDLTPPL